MSQATIEQKVQDYLRHSELFEQGWQTPITPGQLQAEVERMAEHDKQPEVLRKLFAADSARPAVVQQFLGFFAPFCNAGGFFLLEEVKPYENKFPIRTWLYLFINSQS